MPVVVAVSVASFLPSPSFVASYPPAAMPSFVASWPIVGDVWTLAQALTLPPEPPLVLPVPVVVEMLLVVALLLLVGLLGLPVAVELDSVPLAFLDRGELGSHLRE